MKVLVTGSTGFVGSHLCDKLANEGHDVYAQARNRTKFDHFNVKGTLIEGELSAHNNHRWIDSLPNDLDAVVYTVGIVHTFTPQNFYRENSDAFIRFTEELKVKYPKLKLIFVSSLAASGPSELDHPICEQTICAPVSHYGKSKLQAERQLAKIIPKTWSSIIIRPPMVIGPRDPAVLDLFKMVKSRVVLYPGLNGADNRYSFVSVFDLVDLIGKALDSDKEAPVYFASFPQTTTFIQIINKIAQLVERKHFFKIPIPRPILPIVACCTRVLYKFFKVDVRLTPDKVSEMIQPAWTCSSKLSVEQLGMEYNWGLDRIIESTYIDYCERQWL